MTAIKEPVKGKDKEKCYHEIMTHLRQSQHPTKKKIKKKITTQGSGTLYFVLFCSSNVHNVGNCLLLVLDGSTTLLNLKKQISIQDHM